jgi:hypothetical protein
MREFQKMSNILKKMFKDVQRERKGAYKVLLGKPEGWRPLGRPGRRWEDNVEMTWSRLTWPRTETGSIKCGVFLD